MQPKAVPVSSTSTPSERCAAARPADGGGGYYLRPELRQVLAALGAGLAEDAGSRDLPGIFERELQRALSVRAVRLREIPPRYHARLVTPTRTPDSIVLGVPSGDPRVQAILEASGGPERALDDVDHEAVGGRRRTGRPGARGRARAWPHVRLPAPAGGGTHRLHASDADPQGASRTGSGHRFHGADRG